MSTLQSVSDLSKGVLSRLNRLVPEDAGTAQNEGGIHQGACDRHGEYPISLQDEQGVTRYRPAVCPACLAEQKSSRLMRSAAIPKRHQGCRFDNFVVQTAEQQAIFDVCLDYANTFRKKAFQSGACLIMSGNCGTGKNHLATAITRVVMESGFSVVQTTVRGMIERIRESWGKSQQTNEDRLTERKAIQGFADVDLLILDEVGKQFGGGKGDEVHLFEVINRRYLDMKPTIVLSNETPKNIEAYMGIAAYDRLCEKGTLLCLDWQGYRRGQPV